MSTRILARCSTAVIPPLLLTAATLLSPAYADHDTTHTVQNLKGGLGALEQRVWDCEQGISGCTGIVGAVGPQGAAGNDGAVGATGPAGPQGDPSTDTLGALTSCFEGETVIWDGSMWTCGSPEVSPVDPVIASLLARIAALEPTTLYSIGETGPAGGLVFHVTDGGLHGLEAAPVDQGAAAWGCYGTALAGADATAVGTGERNTADILAGCTDAGIAARLADAYVLNTYDDWFLPSIDTLNSMYTQLRTAGLGGFANRSYWSSSESSSYGAWDQYFVNDSQYRASKFNTNKVRAVRAF